MGMDMSVLLTYAGAVILILVLGKLFLWPLKMIFKIAVNSIAGGIVILIISALLIGVSFYERYKDRVNSLEMFIGLLSKYLLKLKMERKSFTDIVLNEKDPGEYLSECQLS